MNIGTSPIVISLRRIFFRFWRPGVLVLSLLAVMYLLYFRQLGSLLPGYSYQEMQALLGAKDWHHIADNPVNAPYSALVWLGVVLTEHSAYLTRFVAAAFGTLAVLAFFAIIRNWYSFRIAFLGTLLFATSSGFLHVARLGTAQVLQMGILALLATALWYKHSKHRSAVGYVMLGLCAVLWYIPGMMWIELLGLALVWRSVWGQLHRTPKLHVIGSFAAFLLILTPLIGAAVRNPDIFFAFTGLPSSLNAVSHIANNLWHTLVAVGIWGKGEPLTWLGRMPLLDVAERILCAVGVYAYLWRKRSLRATFLAGAAAVSVLLISFDSAVGFAALVPILYLFIVHGLDHLLGRWFVVFPRNPIARYIGVAAICIMLAFSITFHARSYFVAWPHNKDTRQTFSLSANLLQ